MSMYKTCPKTPWNCKCIYVDNLWKGEINMPKKKKKTIGVMSQNRGVMPPPVRADKIKKGKGSYDRNVAKKVGVYEWK